MTEKMRHSSLQFGNKGFILLLDVVIAVFLVIVSITAISHFSEDLYENPLRDMSIYKTGSDITALLIHQGVLATLDENTITNGLYSILPSRYDMYIDITCESGSTLTLGGLMLTKDFVASGSQVFIIPDASDYCTAAYYVWLR